MKRAYDEATGEVPGPLRRPEPGGREVLLEQPRQYNLVQKILPITNPSRTRLTAETSPAASQRHTTTRE